MRFLFRPLLAFIEWLADQAYEKMATPQYVALSVFIFIAWIVLNTLAVFRAIRFDSYPYILLNLVMSAQSMISMPLIMMGQKKAEKRQSQQEEERQQEKELAEQQQRERDERHDRQMLTVATSSQTIIKAIAHAMGVDHETSRSD